MYVNIIFGYSGIFSARTAEPFRFLRKFMPWNSLEEQGIGAAVSHGMAQYCADLTIVSGTKYWTAVYPRQASTTCWWNG